MTLRARLALTLLLLAVIPLCGMTIYSYAASQRAYRRAVEAEAQALAGELPERMERAALDLNRRIEKLGDLPFDELSMSQPGDAPAPETLRSRLDAELGPAAPLVASLEFTPFSQPEPAPAGSRRLPPPPPRVPAVPAVDKILVLAAAERLAVQVPVPGRPEAPQWVFRYAKEGEQARITDGELKTQIAEITKAAAEARTHALAKAERHVHEATRKAEAAGREAKTAEGFALHREFGCTATRQGAAVGRLRAKVHAGRMLVSVLAATRRRPGDLAFAIDEKGGWHVPQEDQPRLKEVAAIVEKAPPGEATPRATGDWVVATRQDAKSGLTWGLARPLGPGLQEIRATTIRNLLAGLAVIGLASIGILPLSRRMTRDIAALTEGAERLARGDLSSRVPVRGRDEIGRLSETFNRMAAEIGTQQEHLVQQERLRRELELCRRIQEDMLPRDPLPFPFAEVQGLSIPAREVGGDFFNYFPLPGGEAALLVGDVSGRGVAAALLMANVQATLRARLPLSADLTRLAEELDREIETQTPRPTYLTLFVGVLDGARRLLRYVNAGQNPPILLRRSGEIVRLDPTGRPLGLLAGGGYQERSLKFAAGDAFLLYTDGLVESEDERGEPFGLARLEKLLADANQAPPEEILARIESAVRMHRGGAELLDDATVVVLRVGPEQDTA
jgi:serine phosphatase RsbU (regulator of sigma subunit)